MTSSRRRRRADARGPDARDLRPRQRPAGLSAAARVPGAKLKRTAGISCTADEILITSGSLQGSIWSTASCSRAATPSHRGGHLLGLAQPLDRLGVNAVGIPLDGDGMRMDALAAALDDLERRSIRPKYIYTIPTVQNPTGTIWAKRGGGSCCARRTARRADLRGRLLRRSHLGRPPPAGAVCHEQARRRHPYRLVLQVDRAGAAGRLTSSPTGACFRGCCRSRPTPAPARWSRWCSANSASAHFDTHVPELTRGLRNKLETLMDALNEQFGTAAEFEDPKGGIFLWVKLPDQVDTLKLVSGRVLRPASPSIPGRNGPPTRPTARAARGCASPTRRTRPSAPASPRSPKSAAANSACRSASPMCSRARA